MFSRCGLNDTSAYLLPQRENTQKVFLYFGNNLKPQVKIKAPSDRAVLINTQWFILVTFKNNLPKGKVYKLVIRAIHCLCNVTVYPHQK